MTTPSTYDLSNTQLLDEMINIALRARGRQTPGRMDLGSRGQLEYFRGVALSRLDGAERPFKKGQNIRVCDGEKGDPVCHLRAHDVLTVEQIQYRPDQPEKWHVRLERAWGPMPDGFFSHEYFEAVS